MKKLLVWSLAFVLIISALLLLAGCKKECTHSYEKTVTPPNCTEAGKERFDCTKCDHFYIVETDKANGVHNVQNGVCTFCGGKESTPGLKYIQNADGTYTVTGKGSCTETDIVIGIYNNRDVTTIGDSAFYYCTSLTSIELPDSLTTIGYEAFSDCTRLTSIVIPEGVTTIGERAFDGCSSLKSIELPDSLTTIGVQAFYWCTSLKSIVIPEGVTTIGNDAFYNCISLTSIELPDSLTTIGDNAFSWCDSLKSIVIPEGVTTIGVQAFYNCTSLKSIVIPEGVTAIGNDAFSYCTSLTRIELPDSLTAIGADAFHDCDSLTSITVAEGNENYKSIDGNLYSKDGEILIQYAIGKTDTAFTVPEGVTTLGDNAFSRCISLKSIVIPDSLTAIGADAFSWCASLKSIVIPEGVTTIRAYAFSNCTSLTIYCEVAEKQDGWSNSWNSSNRPVVWGCQVTGDGFVYETTNNSVSILKYIGLDNNIVIPTVIDGKNVTTIGDRAFSSCYSLTSIELPDSLTTIGERAFSWCTSLTSIVIPEGVTTIGNYAFYWCTSLTIYCEVAEKPEGWDSDWNSSNCPVIWGYTGE